MYIRYPTLSMLYIYMYRVSKIHRRSRFPYRYCLVHGSNLPESTPHISKTVSSRTYNKYLIHLSLADYPNQTIDH